MIADKYKVKRLLDLIEDTLCASIKALENIVVSPNTNVSLLQDMFSLSGMLYRHTKIAARCGLSRYIECCGNYIQVVLLKGRAVYSTSNVSEDTHLSQFVLALSQEGYPDIACLLAAKVLGNLEFRYVFGCA